MLPKSKSPTLILTLTRLLVMLSLTITLRGSVPAPTAASTAAPHPARPHAARFVDDVEGCREQPVAQPSAPAACE
jgi:hypothetical protein